MIGNIILSFALCIFLIENVLGNDHPFCKNATWDTNFDAKHASANIPKNGAYILLGNKAARQHWSQFLHGNEMIPDEDFSQLCAKVGYHVHDDKIQADYRGFGNLVADANCFPMEEPGVNCLIISQRNSSYTDKATVYVSYVDKKDFHSYYVVVYCYENGDVGWLVNTLKRRNITEEDKATILTQVESFGIDIKDTVELYADACDQQ